jgi:hypothetical protein
MIWAFLVLMLKRAIIACLYAALEVLRKHAFYSLVDSCSEKGHWKTWIIDSDCCILFGECLTLLSVFYHMVLRILLTPDFIFVENIEILEHFFKRIQGLKTTGGYYSKHMWRGLHHASTEAWYFPRIMLYIEVSEAFIWRFVKRYKTFMNVIRCVVKHASNILNSSAYMASFRAFIQMILHLLQQKRYRQTDRQTDITIP